MPKYTAPEVAHLIFADLPLVAGQVDEVHDRYKEAMEAVKGHKGVFVAVEAADLTQLFGTAMAAIMLMKEQQDARVRTGVKGTD